MKYIYFTFLCFLLFSGISRGQNPGELDLSFNPNGINTGTGANQFVHASVRQPDGKIISVGNFTAYNGSARNRIIRINPDGTLDPTFNIGTGANATIWTVVLQSDGKILIGGDFTQFNGVARSGIARLNSDGSVDSNFTIGTGFNGRVYTIFNQANGKILVGGEFSGFNGVSRPLSARLEANGLLDPSYVPGYSGGPVRSIVSTSDGSIYIAGGFTFNIVKLTSSGAPVSNWCQCGISGWVFALHVQDDNKLLVGGKFTSSSPTGNRNDLIRINPNGTIDTSFFFSGLTINNYILSISPQNDGKIFIAGNFQSQRWNVARLNSNGSLDNTFNTMTGGTNMPLWNVLSLPDGKAIVGGEFTSVNGNARNYLAQLNSDGTYEVMGAGANNGIMNMALQQDGKVLVGGFFTTYNGISRPYLRRLNTDGTLDTSFNLGQAGPNSFVYSISIQADGKIIIIGDFTTYNGVSRNKIARLNPDGSLDVTFNPGTGISGSVSTFSQLADGKIIIAGDFTSFNGISRNRIARLNLDGSIDTSFNPAGPNSSIDYLETQSDGKILIAGYFSSYNGVPRNWIARLSADGSLDTSFNPGTSVNNPVHTIKQMPDGKILIVGDFTTFNGVSRNRIARLNSNGSLDVSFNIGSGANQRVFRIGLQSDGKILIGGGFTSYNGVSINRIARLNLDGSLDSSFNPGTGANEQINAIITQPDGKILLGGVLTTYNGVNRGRILRIYGDPIIEEDTEAPVPSVENLTPFAAQCLVNFSDLTIPTATDNVDGTIQGTTNQSIFPITQQGSSTITWTFTDAVGNSSTQIQTIIVDDTTAPVPAVAQLPVVSGQCSVTVTVPTANDACKGTITGTTTDPTSYTLQGTYTINWTYDDGNGNTSTQTQTVIVDDTTAPVPAVAQLPTISGQCSVTVTAPTANDSCKGTITGMTTDPLTYENQGNYTITWTYDDGNGNTSTQTQTVVVDDTTAPVPAVAELPVISGQCAVTVTAPTANDACAGTITGMTTDPLTYDAQGTYTITWTYDDGNGNTSTQTQTVVVDDTTAPVPAVAELPVISGQCAVTVTAPTANDACAGTITGMTTDPLTYDTQGTYTINWTYDDGNGNTSTQTQTVIVDDTTAPVPALPQLPVVSGQCAVTVTAPTANDTCKGTITGTTTDPTSYTEQGTYTITWTYDDSNGNFVTQEQTVIVDDTTAPVPAVAELPTISGQCSVTVTAPSANDACEGTITGTTTDPTNYTEQGTYTITWTYNDGNGNSVTQQQTVIVDDTTAPVPAVAELPVISGQCSVTVTAPTANDACEGTITGTTTDPTSYTEQGTYTITWTYDDGNGNTSTQTQTVIVDDTTAPVPAVAELPTISGQCEVTVTAPTANDACEGVITGTSTDPLTYDAQGTYTVTWTYNDGNGNSVTQQQTVIVSDVTNPTWSTTPGSLNRTISCGQSNLLAQAQLLAPIASDNCSVIAVEKTAGLFVPSGPNGAGTITNTWVARDVNSNLSQAFTQVITVQGIQIDASASSTPIQIGTTATLSASVTPAVAGVSVNFYLDDVLKGTSITNSSGTATLTVSGLGLDVYKVTAIVGSGCAESIAYLPVYDPNGNFVTGGGWINSPVGALIGTTTVGKANFGFVSKYKKGSNQVDGNTEFQFSAGNLSFKSTLHEAGTLVISGRKATYRGDGMVNGAPGYRFTITAIDGHWNGGTGPDQFRIKIWGSNGVLYDNGLGADDNSDIATSLGGGSIVIHEAKARGTKRVVTDLITVPWNTSAEAIKQKLDQMSTAWFESRKLEMTLDANSYDPLTSGFYELKADLVENEFFKLDEPISIQVLVQDKPKALDIELSSKSISNQMKAGDQIAFLSTVDPVDNIHTYRIEGNPDLTVEGNRLIWRGTGMPEAQMKLTVFSADRAGQTISKEITLFRELKIGEFLIYPNPAAEQTNVLVELDQPSQVSLSVFDAVGKLVISDQFSRETTFVQTLDLNGLAPGMYTVQIQVGQMVMTGRLIKK